MQPLHSPSQNKSQLMAGDIIINKASLFGGAFGHAGIVVTDAINDQYGNLTTAPSMIHATNKGIVTGSVQMHVNAPVFRPDPALKLGRHASFTACANAKLFLTEAASGTVKHRSQGVKSFFSMMNPGGSKNLAAGRARVEKLESRTGTPKLVQCSEMVVLCYQMNQVDGSMFYIQLNAAQASPGNLADYLRATAGWLFVGTISA